MEFEEIKVIRGALLKKLRRHHNVNGGGLSKDEFGWYIKVNLVKQHRWWHRKLPQEFQGARVRYQVIGVVRAW